MTQVPVRLLVVGGSGFLGRHVVSHAVSLGWEVISVGVSSGRAGTLPGVRHVVADIANADVLRDALPHVAFDYVVNCAGYIRHVAFREGGGDILDAHFRGVLNLVQLVDRSALRSFVNIGSSDEYGHNPAPQQESVREAPISPYSAAKVAATHFLQMLHRMEQFPSTTLRLFLTYGPGQDEGRFLPQIIRGCLDGRSFPVSEGRQVRDFCFIDDTVRAVFAALDNNDACGEVLNVGSGEPSAIRYVIETVRRLTGTGDPRFGEIAYRPGENMNLVADIARAQKILNWQPEVTLEEGLRRTIAWMAGRP